MSEWIRGFSVLAAFCGAALRLAPEGGVRRVMSVLICTVLLLNAFQSSFLVDPDPLERQIGRLREGEQRFALESSNYRQRMDRLVIEEELRTYIQNKAGNMDLELSGIELEMQWQTEGFWLPVGLTMVGSGDLTSVEMLQRELEAELGIPGERQQWIADEGMEG